MRGLINIVVGGIMVVGGLSGGLVLRGTHSGGGLAAVGAVLIALGLYRVTRTSGSQPPSSPAHDDEGPPPNDGPPVTRG